MSTKDKRTLILVAVYVGIALVAIQCQKLFPKLKDSGASVTRAAQLSMGDLSKQILEDCNALRSQQGETLLGWEDHLATAAVGHSKEMIDLDYFEHNSPVASSLSVVQRVEQTGISPDAVGECIYESEGYPSREVPNACVQGWFHSPPHHKIMLDPRYNRGGVGVSKKGDLYRITMVFSVMDPASPTPSP